MLNISKTLENGELVFVLEGRLDTLTASALDQELEALLPEARKVTFNFEKLEYLSSSGLRSLLSAQQYMEGNGFPRVVVVGANDAIKDTFELTGFDQFMDVV